MPITAEVRMTGCAEHPQYLEMYRQLAGGLTTAHVMQRIRPMTLADKMNPGMRWGGLSHDLPWMGPAEPLKVLPWARTPKRVGTRPGTPIPAGRGADHCRPLPGWPRIIGRHREDLGGVNRGRPASRPAATSGWTPWSISGGQPSMYTVTEHTARMEIHDA